MLRFVRNKLCFTVFLLGLAVTTLGLLFLWPRFAFLPVILIFPPIIFGGPRKGDGAAHRGGDEDADSAS